VDKTKRVVEFENGVICIKTFRNPVSDDAEIQITEIELVDNVTSFPGIGEIRSYPWEPYICPECEDSDVPGRHYNNADTSSGQFVLCQTCNADGDTSPDCPDYDPEDFRVGEPL
jgi:hypothetical protein